MSNELITISSRAIIRLTVAQRFGEMQKILQVLLLTNVELQGRLYESKIET